ncbi:MAG: sigma-70 family RNA polymerase sigma factor [Cytophagales bacterium]|nr:sigma-70 family RNA polymerase sigma factor [Cytophagales bacterium]
MSAILNNDRFRKLLAKQPALAIQLLHQLHGKSLYQIARQLTQDPNAAQDIIQDTFTLIWEKRHQLSRHHEKSLLHFIVRVVRNKSITHFKRKKLFNIDQLRFLQQTDGDTFQDQLIKDMRKHINTFSLREQQCTLLKIDHNLSLDQIATQLGVSRKMVEKAQTSALKKLRQWAKDYQPE